LNLFRISAPPVSKSSVIVTIPHVETAGIIVMITSSPLPEAGAEAEVDFNQEPPREEEFDFDQRTEWDDEPEV
jgi:hypothetical protein